MKKSLALFATLSLFALPAFAATSIGMEGLIQTVVYFIVIGIVFGLLIFLVNKAPFIPPEWKQFIVYFIYFVAGLCIINLLLGMAGYPIFTFRN